MSISDDWAVGSATAVHERSPSASVLDMNYFLQSLHNVCFELSAPFPNHYGNCETIRNDTRREMLIDFAEQVSVYLSFCISGKVSK